MANDRFLNLDAVVYASSTDIQNVLADIAWNVLPTAKDEWDAQDGAENFIERAVEGFESDLRSAIENLISDWQNMDCEECEGSGECPDCEWMIRDNPEALAEEIANCGSCGGTAICPHCEGSGSEFQR